MRHTLGTIESTYSQWINILTAQIYPAETQPRASLNNMHPNLAWTLWGGDQDALTNRSWHTHAYTQASRQARRVRAPQQTQAQEQIVNLPLTHTTCTPRPHNPCVSQTHWKTHDAACIFCFTCYSYISTTCLLVYILKASGFCFCEHIYLAAWSRILKLSTHINNLYINYVL